MYIYIKLPYMHVYNYILNYIQTYIYVCMQIYILLCCDLWVCIHIIPILIVLSTIVDKIDQE